VRQPGPSGRGDAFALDLGVGSGAFDSELRRAFPHPRRDSRMAQTGPTAAALMSLNTLVEEGGGTTPEPSTLAG